MKRDQRLADAYGFHEIADAHVPMAELAEEVKAR
jgi:hypothetical protein